MAVDTLKVVIEADAAQAMNTLEKFHSTEKKVASETTNMKTAVTGLDGSFAKLRIGGEGLNLGFMKVAGAAGAAFLAVRTGIRVISDLTSSYEKLYPEAAKAEGSQARFSESANTAKAAVGKLISDALAPLRGMFIEIVGPTNTAAAALDEYNKIVDERISKNLAQYMSEETKATKELADAKLALAQASLDAAVARQEETRLQDQAKAKFAEIQKFEADKARLLKLGQPATFETQKLAVLTSEYDKILADLAAVQSRIPKINELAKEVSTVVNQLKGAYGAGFAESYANMVESTGTRPYTPPPAEAAVSEIPRFIRMLDSGPIEEMNVQWQRSIDLTEGLSDVLQKLGSQAVTAGLQELTGGMEALGKSLGSVSTNALEEWFGGFMSRLPQLLLQAGLTIIASFPGNYAALAIGSALILASGLVAFGVGISEGNKARNEELNRANDSAAMTASNAAGSQRMSYTLVNVYGNVWSEADLTTAVISRAGQY